jgi:hypothetical protein
MIIRLSRTKHFARPALYWDEIDAAPRSLTRAQGLILALVAALGLWGLGITAIVWAVL